MGLFRRKQETLNERLLREAGLDPAQSLGDSAASAESEGRETEPEPPDLPPPPPRRDPADVIGGRKALWWDAVTTARVAALAGDQVEFTTLPNGDVIVEKEKGDGDLSPLADAVEKKIEPPYRAVAARQDGDLWGIGAKRIEVAKFQLADGEAVELTENDGEQEVRVDGEPSDAEVPELVELGEHVGADYCVEARRIDGDLWEVEVSAL